MDRKPKIDGDTPPLQVPALTKAGARFRLPTSSIWRRDLVANMIGHWFVDFVGNVVGRLLA
jgi:hypothetical protein